MFIDRVRPEKRDVTTGEDGFLLDVHEQSCDWEWKQGFPESGSRTRFWYMKRLNEVT